MFERRIVRELMATPTRRLYEVVVSWLLPDAEFNSLAVNVAGVGPTHYTRLGNDSPFVGERGQITPDWITAPKQRLYQLGQNTLSLGKPGIYCRTQ